MLTTVNCIELWVVNWRKLLQGYASFVLDLAIEMENPYIIEECHIWIYCQGRDKCFGPMAYLKWHIVFAVVWHRMRKIKDENEVIPLLTPSSNTPQHTHTIISLVPTTTSLINALCIINIACAQLQILYTSAAICIQESNVTNYTSWH